MKPIKILKMYGMCAEVKKWLNVWRKQTRIVLVFFHFFFLLLVSFRNRYPGTHCVAPNIDVGCAINIWNSGRLKFPKLTVERQGYRRKVHERRRRQWGWRWWGAMDAFQWRVSCLWAWRKTDFMHISADTTLCFEAFGNPTIYSRGLVPKTNIATWPSSTSASQRGTNVLLFNPSCLV